MDNNERLYISTDAQQADFKKVLDGNDRCILSARFGDGKSRFLKEFIAKYNNEYIFVPIYPVNYQVIETKDVFEYIKRDILLKQLVSDNFLLIKDNIPEELYIKDFLKKNWKVIGGELIKFLPSVNFFGLVEKSPKDILDVFKSINAGYQKYKEDEKSDVDKIESFISRFDDKSTLYEFDVFSQFIYQLNEAARLRSQGKKVVLIIEDLDRIDPDHIFRILNIFSAHFDYHDADVNKKKSFSENEFVTHNKYGFDKIITVCDYDNIEKIFHHKYGADTDFQGYIHKFTTTQPYWFSLRYNLIEYVKKLLDKKWGNCDEVNRLLATMIYEKHLSEKNETSLRHIVTELEKEIVLSANRLIPIPSTNYLIHSNNELTRFLTILYQLRINLDEFHNQIISQQEVMILFFLKIVKECVLVYSSQDSDVAVSFLNSWQSNGVGIETKYRKREYGTRTFTKQHLFIIAEDDSVTIQNMNELIQDTSPGGYVNLFAEEFIPQFKDNLLNILTSYDKFVIK